MNSYFYDEGDDNDTDAYLDRELKLTKKGKPRKRRPKQPQIYFTKDTEEAILEYLAETNQDIRNEIYNTRIRYSFYKLAENIIHTFKFYYTDTDTIEELKHEVITFLLEKLHLYRQEKGAAYSYFGTIAKRYLINYNQDNYEKLQEKAQIEEVDEEDNTLIDHSSNPLKDDLNEFITQYINYFDSHMATLFPKPKDAHTADAVMELFRRRESLEIFNKKALYIYIREMTDVETPQITRIIKKLKDLYVRLYSDYYRDGHLSDNGHIKT
jgi:hypothetical protein